MADLRQIGGFASDWRNDSNLGNAQGNAQIGLTPKVAHMHNFKVGVPQQGSAVYADRS
jgi:hypothetical protein